MLTLKRKITTAIATSAVLLNALAPVAFAETVVVSGNGDSSNSTVNVSNTNTTAVTQNNTANVTNTVISNSSTGGNTASRNTGGNSVVSTGDATSNVDVRTNANVNVANVENCNCDNDTTIAVQGNGVQSQQNVNVAGGNTTALNQNNATTVVNTVSSNADTGDNHANRNTGGNSVVLTGNATTDTTIRNMGGVNQASVGNGGAGNLTGGTAVVVSGNGDSSKNSVTLLDQNTAALNQTNSTVLLNTVFSNANTGGNSTNRNTGGDSIIDTGNAKNTTVIRNDANYNLASFDQCGCSDDTLLKIFGNGVQSQNAINALLGSTLAVNHSNSEVLNNAAFPTSTTGDNHANRNTGALGLSDPAVYTGNATDNTTIHNAGNTNTFGSDAVLHLPTWMNNVQVSADFSAMWSAWMMMWSNHS